MVNAFISQYSYQLAHMWVIRVGELVFGQTFLRFLLNLLQICYQLMWSLFWYCVQLMRISTEAIFKGQNRCFFRVLLVVQVVVINWHSYYAIEVFECCLCFK